MATNCMYCNAPLNMPFICKFCNLPHCVNHQLPENHGCIGLSKVKESQRESLKAGKPEKPLEYFKETNKRPPSMRFVLLLIGSLILIIFLALFVSGRIKLF